MTKSRLYYAMARVFVLPCVLLYVLIVMQHAQHMDNITYPAPVGSPEYLMAQCVAPVHGAMPNAVVLIPEGKGNARMSHSTRLINEALAQVFADGPTHHTVIGFCG